jgi:chaperonin GroEL
MTRSSRQRVRFAPEVHRGIDRGVNQIADAIRPTLGPTPRLVGVDRGIASISPELLDDGATIARRIVALPDALDDPGAMYLRGLLWRLQDEVGDGTATAAVLFSALLADGRRAIAAGIPAQLLRSQLEAAGNFLITQLETQSITRRSEQLLAGIAASACHDAEMAGHFGEIFDVIGEYGQLDIRESRRRESWVEFVEGAYWDTGALTTSLFTDPVGQRSELHDAAIVTSDLSIDDPAEMIPLLELAMRVGSNGLLIVAASISDRALGLITANQAALGFPVAVVKTPGFSLLDQRDALEDLSFILGGRPLIAAAGDKLAGVAAGDLGGARRAWATRTQFGIINGMGDPRALRTQAAWLAEAHHSAEKAEDQKRFLTRLGKFQGGSATLWLGGVTESEIKHRQETAQRVARVIRGAAREGIVPGGGSALIACQPALAEQIDASCDPLARTALRVVHDAIEAPTRTICENAGFEAAPILAAIRRSGSPCGFDVLSGSLVDMRHAGIVDSAQTLKRVVQATIASAALALTIDVIVHTRKSEISVNPE